ncbi:signal peptidase [Cryptococcus wingfieldii CBS 7118]|uniref:Signal peptidase subunit 3 n=1 Tax=Cryptococcus wingfieldii CBS 7118 TaxID=1295528 RepID=A0A1E3IXS9_9TREE|nr:signal peptidase [Cryptococcus wingfieldii CBS 7118]ODN93399.1 signal peptidase [Cryptococcus wingfieldii CBS 7118]
MYSTVQRLNHLSSLATTYLLALLALVSLASFLAQPPVSVGSVHVKDLILTKGRLNRLGARPEELASLRFDIRTDLNPLLNSYNTKQLFVYLTATYEEESSSAVHDVVLWDRIITRKKGRGNVRVEDGKNKYQWHNPSHTFKDIPTANFTLHYSLMPYVGVLSSGVAAVAEGPVAIPELIKR